VGFFGSSAEDWAEGVSILALKTSGKIELTEHENL